MNAGHFEAKKHAVRQTQDGWVVSFTVHPNDMSPDFATAPLGTRYMVGFAAIGDDEEIIPIRSNDAAADPRAGESVAASQRGGDPLSSRSEAGKQRYASASDMEQARIRAALLPRDTRFCAWVAGTRWNGGDLDTASEHTAIKHIRDTCCAGESRKLIAKDRSCFDAFIRMEASFLIETNQMAEPR